MSESVNRAKCDCLNCHNPAGHSVTTVLDGQMRERHLCHDHFGFLSRTYPLMLNEEASAEFRLSDADFEAFLDGDEVS